MFQKAPSTPEELAAAKPVDIAPDKVAEMDEATWYAQVYRGEDSPQLTIRAVSMGAILGFFLAFTNLYIGLKTGWHLGVAITACILSFTLWNVFQKVGLARTPMTILENNCMQSTASSAGYSTGSTMVSAIPALLMLSVTEANPKGTHLPIWVLALWTFFLALLGVSLAIPMKRNMINQERLKFPSGLASAATLQSLYAEGKKAAEQGKYLMLSAIVGGIFPALLDLKLKPAFDPETGLRIMEPLADGSMKAGRQPLLDSLVSWFEGGYLHIFNWLPVGGFKTVKDKVVAATAADWNVMWEVNPVMMAAGALTGVRATVSMMIGAVTLVWIVGPYAMDAEWVNLTGKTVTAITTPGRAWKETGLWLGAPMMVSSGLVAFLFQWRTIVRAFQSLGGGGETSALEAKTEVPMSWFLAGAGPASIGIVLLSWYFFHVPPYFGALAVVMTFALCLVAARATGETDVTPTGAMGKVMQLTYGVLIPQSSTANLMTAGITAGAAATTADLLNDLKSGYLLGANPRRQFLAQAAGILSGTIATVIGFHLLVPDATTLLGTDTLPPAFPAPAAQAWKAVAELFQHGVGNMHPVNRMAIGIGLSMGTVLAVLEQLLPKYKKYLPSPTGIGLGFILPFFNPFSLFVGSVIAEVVRKSDESLAERTIVPISSGLIAGISIIGVIVTALNNFVL